jgi:hypothetical protein
LRGKLRPSKNAYWNKGKNWFLHKKLP